MKILGWDAAVICFEIWGTGDCVESLSGFDLFQNGRDQGLRCVA